MKRREIIGAVAALVLLTAFVADAPCQDRSIVRVGRDVVVEKGTAVRDAVAVGGSVTVRGTVENDAVAVGGNVSLAEGARVGRNAVAVGGIVECVPGAQVAGDLVEVGVPQVSTGTVQGARQGLRYAAAAFRFLSLLSFLALALLVAAVVPHAVEDVSRIVAERAGASFLWGIVGMLLIVPAALLLAFSIVGIALIPIEIVFVVLASLFGYVAVGRFVGAQVSVALARRPAGIVLETLIGVVLLWLVGLIPFVGWLVQAVAFTLGFGAVLMALYHATRRPPPVPPATAGEG